MDFKGEDAEAEEAMRTAEKAAHSAAPEVVPSAEVDKELHSFEVDPTQVSLHAQRSAFLPGLQLFIYQRQIFAVVAVLVAEMCPYVMTLSLLIVRATSIVSNCFKGQA